MEHAWAHGVEQDRLHTVPPDGGGDLHRTVRRVHDAHRLRGVRSILIAIHRPEPTAARLAAYRFAAFVDLTRHRPRSWHASLRTGWWLPGSRPRTQRGPCSSADRGPELGTAVPCALAAWSATTTRGHTCSPSLTSVSLARARLSSISRHSSTPMPRISLALP